MKEQHQEQKLVEARKPAELKSESVREGRKCARGETSEEEVEEERETARL